MPGSVRARETEAQMTDEQRFSLIVSVMGTDPMNPVRDERIPAGVPRSRVLQPGESRRVSVTAEPRQLARFGGDAGRWHITAGTYRVALGRAADDLVLTAEAHLKERRLGR